MSSKALSSWLAALSESVCSIIANLFVIPECTYRESRLLRIKEKAESPGFRLESCRNDGWNYLPAISRRLRAVVTTAFVLFSLAGVSSAAGIKVVPSAPKVMPGETFYADVVVEGIPSEGLGAIQFRLNVSAPGSTVAAVSDTALGQPAEISVSSPLIIGSPTASRSGLGDFFLNAKGSHGILVMENEALQSGSGLYTLGHTNGASLPSGSGSVARFQINPGSEADAEKIIISLSDVALLDGSTVYPLESNTGATIDLKCYTQVPNLIGLSNAEATAALSAAQLTLGTVYEIDNTAGTHALNTVLVQSASAGTTILCETPVDLAINTPPDEVSNFQAIDKSGDESGTLVFSWIPSTSSDVAGYRFYNASGTRLTDVGNPAAAGAELSGLPNGQSQQFRITAYDAYGNESAGVSIAAAALDDVAPRISINGVSDGVYYASDVQPVITVQEANLAEQEIMLNGLAYNQSLLTLEDAYLLRVQATDTSGNSTAKEIRFTIDKTPPVITVSGIEKNRYYNTDLSPAVSVADANIETVESSLNGSAYTSGTVITAENNYELLIQAADKAGNSSSDTYTFHIDKTKPVSTVTAATPKYENAGTLYVGGQTAFTLSGTDAGIVESGVDRLEYRANSAVWSVYQAPITLAALNDGAVSIDYRAIDQAANREDFQTLAVTLDSTAPVTTLTPGQPQYTDAAGAVYVTQSTPFTLAASDALSGVALTEYQVDAGARVTVSPFTIANEGAHTILYHSNDNLGNAEPDNSFVVNVDNTPPVTTIATGDPKYTANDGSLYVTSATTFTLAATDNLSGVAATEYRIDSGAWTADAPFTIAGEGTHTIDYYSRDNVTNTETFKTLTVIVDNAAPVTTITAGDPKYTAGDGKRYVTSATTFTLAATDNFSGVAATEYRIDGGAWTAYAPFTIAGEGTHTIDYYSKDNVTNAETIKTLAIIVDNTAPASTVAVGTPQYQSDGKQYVAAYTNIIIAAEDAASGVKRTQYSIDGGDWTIYTAAFTLDPYTDGSHTIRYRSLDNVGNIEDAKELAVILDKTPPQTGVSGSDQLIDGVVNTVSPSTFFTLTSEDALSGVKSIAYRINNGSWQAYTGSFSLAGMSAGQHTIACKAIDNVLNEEAEKAITVRLIVIEVSKKIASDPVVLIAAWRHDREDHDGKEKAHDCKENAHCEEKAADRKAKDDKTGHHENHEDDNKRVHGVLDKISGILATAGITHHIPEDEDDFVSSFRSGRYNTYILLDGEEDRLEDMENEIREAVHYGSGVISIKTRPDQDPGLDDLFGVSFKGRTTHRKPAVTLLDSPISNEGTLETASKALVTAITATTAQTFSVMIDKHKTHPAIVYNQYGRGRAILYVFDLLSSPDRAVASALLINSINLVHPAEQQAFALASVPVRIKLNNSPEPLDVRVREYLPGATTADTIIPDQPVIDGTITWEKTLKAGETSMFGYYLNLPDLAGSYRARTEIQYSNLGDYRLFGVYDLHLDVEDTGNDLLRKTIGKLEALGAALPACDAHEDDDDDDRDGHEHGDEDEHDGHERGRHEEATCSEQHLIQAVRELNRIDTLASGRHTAEKNIERILNAIEKVGKLKVDTTGIRLNLDELLRTWEKKWFLMETER